MINEDIFPVDNTGLTPHTDSKTQTVEKIEVDGVPHWKVKNYAFGELNDGSQEWHEVFTQAFNSQANLIANRIEDADLTDEEKAELQAYSQAISAYTEFPVGFVMPTLPACFNKLFF